MRVLCNFFLLFKQDNWIKMYGPLLFILFFFARPFDQKLGFSLLYLLFAQDHSTKMYSPLSYIFPLCTVIRRKIWVFINLFYLFVHHHSTKIRSHSYSVVYSFHNCANISYAKFKAVLPLYSCQYCPYIWYAILIAI